MNESVIWIGPWADEEHPERPHPEDHVDQQWDEQQKQQIAYYVEEGFVVGAPLDGDTPCLLCGEKIYRGFIRTDGVFVWRDGLSHYVREHCVRPPEKFIGHVLVMNEKIDSFHSDDMQWWNGNPYQDSGEGRH